MSKMCAALMLMLGGCAGASEERSLFGAMLAPICVFNCVVSVTYAPGVDELEAQMRVEQQRKLLRE